MKYETNNQEIAKTTVTTALKTVEDNILALSQLVDLHEYQISPTEQSDPIKNARLISIGVAAIEKLLMLNLYARNPLLLFPDDRIKKTDLILTEGYKKFDMNWLFSSSHTFASVDEMWKLLAAIYSQEKSGDIQKYSDEFEILKRIRNKYLHSFIISQSSHASRSLVIAETAIWIILINLIKGLPQYLAVNVDSLFKAAGLSQLQIQHVLENDENALKEVVLKMKSEFHLIKTELSHIQDEPRKRDRLLQLLAVEDLQTTKQKELNLHCPICSPEDDIPHSAYMFLEIEDLEHRIDSDGETHFWEEPWNALIRFNHFYCTHCGFHSNDYFVVEKFGYGTALKHAIWFKWDMNSGAGRLYIADSTGAAIEPN